MMKANHCPGTTLLQAFLDDSVGHRDVGLHVRNCESCQKKLNEWSVDTELDSWRGANANRKEFEAEIGCKQMLSRILATETIPLRRECTPADTLTLRVHLGSPLLPDDLGSIDHYRILKEIGTGGMSIVYEAIDTRLSRHVAIKVLRSSLDGSKALERFRREATAIASIRHSNVIAIHHVDTQSTSVGAYLVMEFIPDESLQAQIQKYGLIESRLAAEWIAQVADGLQSAHIAGVIHRDIKPSNILMKRKGNNSNLFQPILADFGLAHIENADSQLTQSGYLPGTPAYISPEQVHDRIATTLSDVYSLGITLFQLLTGELPFRGSPHAVLQQISIGEIPNPSGWNSAIPVDLETICLKATQFKASQRYPSAKAFADDLRRWLNHEPIQARPISSIERAFRWCQRNSKVAALIGTVFGLLLLLAFGGIWSAISIAGARNELAQQVKTTTRAGIEAEAAGYRAIEQRQLALDSLNTLIDKVQSQLAHKPGTLKLRQELLRTAMDGLERVTKGMDDGQADHAAIKARIQMSKIHTLLGNTEAAALVTNEALSRVEKAVKVDPDSLQMQENFGHVLMLKALAFQAAFLVKDAKASFERASPIFDVLRTKTPDKLELQKAWLECRNKIALISWQNGESENAIAQYESILNDTEKVQANFAGLADLKSTRYLLLIQLASAMASSGRDGAKERFGEAIRLARELNESDSESELFATGEAQLQNRLARMEIVDGNLDAALDHGHRSLRLFQEVAARDVRNTTAQMLVGAAWDQLYVIHLAKGDYAKALEAEHTSYENHVRLCNIDKGAVNFRLMASEAAARIGEIHLRLGDVKQTIDWTEKGIRWMEECQSFPNAPVATITNLTQFYGTFINSVKLWPGEAKQEDSSNEHGYGSLSAQAYSDAVHLFLDAKNGREWDVCKSVASIRQAMPEVSDSVAKELEGNYRSSTFLQLARGLLCNSLRDKVSTSSPTMDAARVQLAVELLAELIREKPAIAASIDSDADFRPYRDAIQALKKSPAIR